MKATRNGFTAIELMISIVVLSLLLALFIPAGKAAYQYAIASSVQGEIDKLSTAIEQFKVQNGGTVVPSRIILSETGYYNISDPKSLCGMNKDVVNRTMSAFRKIFARVPLSVVQKTMPIDWNGDNVIQQEPYLLDGNECLVFFLGGIPTKVADAKNPSVITWSVSGFATTKANPAKVSTSRTEPLYEFSNNRLQDTDGDGMPSYVDGYGTVFAYFASVNSVYDPDDMNLAEPLDDTPTSTTNPVALLGAFAVQDVGLVTSAAPNPYTAGTPFPMTASGDVDTKSKQQTMWVKAQGFQLISAGADGFFGTGGQYAENGEDVLPAYPKSLASATGQAELPGVRARERDNLTNFHPGTLD